MALYSLGDMASNFMLRHQNVRMNAELAQLAREMASGQTADIPRHLKGNYSYIGDVERNLRVLDGYDTAAKEASLFTSAMQTTLGNVQQTTSTLSSDLILAGKNSLLDGMKAVSSNAKGEFGALLSTLNTNVAGRSLFSGAATDSNAFASANAILTELTALVTGETTLSAILNAIDTWFDAPGGGFETNAYQGATTDLPPFLVGEGETIELTLRGDNPTIRDLLKNTAVAALAAEPSLGFPPSLQGALLVSAGENLMTSQGAITSVRADLGYAESRLEESKTRGSAERASFEMSRNELLGVDPYETATRFEAVRFQLESLYTATSRLSQLSLVGYV